MRYQNTLQTAINKAKAELEYAERALIIYNYLLTLNEFYEYDAFRMATDDRHRLDTILTDSELAELRELL